MADKKKSSSKKSSSDVKYFRSPRASALRIVVDVKDGSPVYERFTPFYETFQGDRVKVGYLKTENKEAIKRCEASNAIQEITAKDFKEATEGDDSQVAPV